MDESLDRREGCYRVQEGSRCKESRHHGIWILIVISLAVFTLGANECIAWDSRCFLLGTKLNVNASFLLKMVLVPSGVQGQYPLTLYKWVPFPSVHIFSVRPRALLLPVCFQTNSCCVHLFRSIKCVYHHIFRNHYLIKTTFCANACAPMLV